MIFVVLTVVFTLGVIFNVILNTASAAVEGAILAHLRITYEQRPKAWTKSTELVRMFGANVYPHLRKMEICGLIEHRTRKQRPGEHRGGRDSYWYRMKADEHGDPFLDKVCHDHDFDEE